MASSSQCARTRMPARAAARSSASWRALSRPSIPCVVHVNAFTNAAPAARSSPAAPSVSGDACAPSAKSTTDRPARCAALSRSSSAVVTGHPCVCSATHVTPAAAAAADPWAKSSRSVGPGSMKCTWESTIPGSATRPSASIVRRARPDGRSAMPAIRPSSTTSVPRRSPSGVTSSAPAISRSAATGGRASAQPQAELAQLALVDRRPARPSAGPGRWRSSGTR